jgi:adenosine deaminase
MIDYLSNCGDTAKDLSQCLDKFARTQGRTPSHPQYSDSLLHDACLIGWMVDAALFSNHENISRIAAEVVEDAFHENIRVLELRYSPHYIAIGHPNLTTLSIHHAVCTGISYDITWHMHDFDTCMVW